MKKRNKREAKNHDSIKLQHWNQHTVFLRYVKQSVHPEKTGIAGTSPAASLKKFIGGC